MILVVKELKQDVQVKMSCHVLFPRNIAFMVFILHDIFTDSVQITLHVNYFKMSFLIFSCRTTFWGSSHYRATVFFKHTTVPFSHEPLFVTTNILSSKPHSVESPKL